MLTVPQNPSPLNKGVVYFGELGESYKKWWIFNRLTEEQIEQMSYEYNWHRSYSGSGQYFREKANFEHKDGFTYVTQYGGWDI
jgi:hypothetical protein